MPVAEINTADPAIRALIVAVRAAMESALDAGKWGDPQRHMVTAMALAQLVWEYGAVHPRIPTTTTNALMNMVVDNGMAEEIGLVVAKGSPTIQ